MERTEKAKGKEAGNVFVGNALNASTPLRIHDSNRRFLLTDTYKIHIIE